MNALSKQKIVEKSLMSSIASTFNTDIVPIAEATCYYYCMQKRLPIVGATCCSSVATVKRITGLVLKKNLLKK